MGCSGSKTEDLPVVARCRERRELIRAAANHRYTLAAAHVSYFRSLKDVGNALRKFVDEELITSTRSSSSSVVSSPSLSLPPNSKKKNDDDSDEMHLHDEDENASHLQISSSSFEDDNSDLEDDRHRHRNHSKSFHKNKDYNNDEASHLHEEVNSDYPRGNFSGYGFGDEVTNDPYSYPLPPRSYGESYPDQYNWGPPGMHPWNYWSNSSLYYMQKYATGMRTVVQEPPAEPSNEYLDSYWNFPSSYGRNYGYFSMGSTVRVGNESVEVSPPKEPPPPPPANASAWDFFNPFDVYDNGYTGYYSSGRYGYQSNTSSPDSSEVRKREGIPDLEEETENEVYKEVFRGKRTDVEAKKRSEQSTFGSKRMNAEAKKNSGGSSSGSKSMPQQKNSEGSSSSVPLYKSEGSSISVPLHKSESSSRSLPSWSSEENARSSVPPHHSDRATEPSTSPSHSKGTSSSRGITGSISLTDEKSSTDTMVSKSVDEDSSMKKGVTFEVSKQDADSSKLSSFTSLSPHGTRDLREVVGEIRDEFEIASSCGKEVAVILEVDKLPYQPGLFKVILSRMLHLLIPSLSLWDHPSRKSMKLASRTLKLAKSYFEDVGKDVNAKACNLSSTLDRLYAWERKLYREVKDEERLRVIYEKQCKRLKILDEEGAECSKIDAAQDSIKRLLTKLDVSIKAIDAIASRIQKLRDEELQPQVATLIHGLIRMWKTVLKCHQKQFEAIMESKMRKLKASTGLQADSSTRAATVLEREVQAWSHHLNDWISLQKSYVESLNGWLLQCVLYEPEETPDGPVPYSPGRLGAPPIFIICNDWHQAMEAITEAKVANAMNTFATSLRQLLERQDDEERQRLKAEYLMKEYEKHLKTRHMNKGKMERDQDAMSDQTGLSVVPSDSGVSPLDDPKVDLHSMRQKAAEERMKHKDARKLVHDAASSSLQGGLVPIFKALKNFSSEALKAHEHVRLQHTEQSL